ncbi:MAG TPA: hypothetical protein PKD70_02270 [Saprospiraceae bacterium]|nr:hypothetical protein [Saprospiraceae bacterium]HMP12677.1 hypothetical protein [Saprospiraceae bacterium]
MENIELWQSGIRPMLWGLSGMAVYVGWLVYFYRHYEPQFSAWLGRCFNVSLRLNYQGYKAIGGTGWLHRIGATVLADLLLLLLMMIPFFVLMIVWWRVFH